MKFGILGAGNHAQNRVMPAIVKAGHEVTAIYSRDVEKAKKIGLKYLSKAYDDLKTFMTGDFEAVYISSPNSLHYEQTVASLKAGKHVLLEKQMTLRNEHAEELVKLAESKGLTLSIGFHMRFHPAVVRMRKMIEGGAIGKPVYASGMWAGYSVGRKRGPDSKWWEEDEKVGGGSVMGTGVHVLDTLNFVLGKHPAKVSSIRLPSRKVIDMTESISLHYGDMIASAVSSRELKNPDNSLYIFGTDGTLAGKGIFGVDAMGSLEHSGETIESYKEGNLYESEIGGFVKQTSGNSTQIANGKDGLIVVKTTNAAFDGDYTARWVDI